MEKVIVRVEAQISLKLQTPGRQLLESPITQCSRGAVDVNRQLRESLHAGFRDEDIRYRLKMFLTWRKFGEEILANIEVEFFIKSVRREHFSHLDFEGFDLVN